MRGPYGRWPHMLFEERQLLFVGGDRSVARELGSALSEEGVTVRWVGDVGEVRALLSAESFDLVLGWCAPGRSVEALLPLLSEVAPDLPLVAIAEDRGLGDALKLVQAGANDHLRVPFTEEEAVLMFRRAKLSSQSGARQQPASSPSLSELGATVESVEMADALATADRAARSNTTILIRGESGVGKEVLARRIHARSQRAGGPFVKVHCAALPEQILESELFGYEKGAFTGAQSRKPGRFELAQGGTIFLDEIGDISPSVQTKLLRVVQDREFERLGGTEVLRADVRILTATHRNLEKMVKGGQFRQDLYYRLNVLSITVPPLRSRQSHVEQLARQFCRDFAEVNKQPVRLSDDAIAVLRRAKWPGNVRQLQNVLERLVVLAESDHIRAQDVERELERDVGTPGEETTEVSALELGAVVRKAEKKALARALERSGGNRALAARILGVSRRTLFYKLREHALG